MANEQVDIKTMHSDIIATVNKCNVGLTDIFNQLYAEIVRLNKELNELKAKTETPKSE